VLTLARSFARAISFSQAGPTPFEATMRRIRSNALELRQQRLKQHKEKQLRRAYGDSARPTAARTARSSPRAPGQPSPRSAHH